MNRGALLTLIQNHEGLHTLWKEAQDQGTEDPAHDLGHLLRVAQWTVILVEESVAPEVCVAAALLHDHINLPKNDPNRHKASELSAHYANARLAELGFAEQDRALVYDAILNHSYSRGHVPETRLGKALQDADRLEALGAMGVMRNAAVGTQMGAVFAHPTDPWAADRTLDDRAFSVDHYFVKLFKLPETMHHPVAIQEARRRAAFMRSFLIQFGEEWGVPFLEK